MRKATGNAPMPEIIGMGEKEARTLSEIAFRFFQAYDEKPEDMSNKAWLANQLARELPELSLKEADDTAERLITGIDEFEQGLASLEDACRHGQSKEEWFRDQSQLAAIGMNVNDYGNRLANIDRSLFMANCQLLRFIAAQDGKSIQRFALDSFLAEQCHVLSFNAHATKVGSPYRAEIFVPDIDKGYNVTTPDVVIKDMRSGRKIYSYRVKFGGREEIGDLAKSETRNTPWIVVASEQLEEMRATYPGYMFTDRLGGTDKIPVMSDALTKAAVLEQETLERYPIKRDDWNNYSTRELALQLGRNAVLTGDVTTAFAARRIRKCFPYLKEQHPMPMTAKKCLFNKTNASCKIFIAGLSHIALEKIMPRIIIASIIGHYDFNVIESTDDRGNGLALLERTEKTALVMLYMFSWKNAHTMQGISLFPVAMAISGLITDYLVDMDGCRISGEAKYLEICRASIKSGLSAVRYVMENFPYDDKCVDEKSL